MGLYDGVYSVPMFNNTMPAVRPAVLAAQQPQLTPEQIAAAQGDALGPVAGGLRAGVHGMKSSLASLYGTGAEAVGADEASKAAYDYAHQMSEQAATEGSSIPAWKDVHSASDFGRFAAGNAARSAPYILPAVAVPAVARGLGAGAEGQFLAGIAANVAPFAGNAAARMHDDPVSAQLPGGERLARSLGEGAADAAIYEAVPHVMGQRAVGAAPFAAKGSLNPLRTVGNIAADTAATSAGMGGAAAGTELLGQEHQTALNPNRDTSGDTDALMEVGVGGAADMTPLALPHAVAARTVGAARAPVTDAVKSVTDKLPGSITDAAGNIRDAAGNLISAAQNVNAENIGQAAGKAVSAVQEKAKNLGDWLNNRDQDANFLTTEQRIDPNEGEAALMRDDEVRNGAAERRATKLAADPDAPTEVKQAATDFLNGPKTGDAWKSVQVADAQYTSQHRFVSSIDKLQARMTRYGIEAGKAASDAQAGYEAGRKMNAQSTDPFDDLLAKTFVQHATSTDVVSDARMAQVTPALREWIANGFTFKKGGEVRVPPELDTMFKDPVAAVTAAHDLMKKQGLLDDEHKGRLQEVTDELNSRDGALQGADATVERYLLPTVQDKHQFTGREHQEIAEQVKHMIERGKMDEPTLDKLFGANKEKLLAEFEDKFVKLKKGVLSPDDSTAHSSNLSDEHDADGLDAERAEAAAHGEEGMSSAVKPNEMKADVGWHGPYDIEREGAARGHKDKMNDLRTLGKNSKDVGVIDRLREDHKDNPEAFVGAVMKAIKANEHNIPPEHAGKPDEYLNKRYRYVRSEDASDKREPIDIQGHEFDNLTGEGKKNKWGMSAGKNREYGGVDNGRLWFERAPREVKESVDKDSGEITAARTTKATEFNTSGGRIITRMREAMKDTGGERAAGIVGQHDMLMQGISSMLSAKNEDGSPALTGRVGIMRNGKVEWMKQGDKLPDNFQLYGGQVKDVGVARERAYNTELVKQMKEWTLKNEERNTREGETAAVRQAIAERDMTKLSVLRDKFVKDSWASHEDIAKPAAYVKETKIVGKATDKETGVQSHVTKTETRHLTEGEEMADAADKREAATPRTHDETTGEEVQPRATRSELADAADRVAARKAEATKPAAKVEPKEDTTQPDSAKFDHALAKEDYSAYKTPEEMLAFGEQAGDEYARLSKLDDADAIEDGSRDAANFQPVWGLRSDAKDYLAGKSGTDFASFFDGMPGNHEMLGKQMAEAVLGVKKNAQETEKRAVLPSTSSYTAKDQAKSDKANKFIGRGSARSSSEAYRKAWGDRANTGSYTAADRVFVSIEGARTGRVGADPAELRKAVEAGATFITDDIANRSRSYNVGEQGLAQYLRKHGYEETAPGEWKPVQRNDQETLDNTRQATPEEIKAANDYITKTLGADMKREFVKTLGGHSADWTPDAQGNVIRIATNAVGGVETNAHHESMHEFFDRLVNGKQEAVAKLLLDAADSPAVKRSLMRILSEYPAAKEAIERDPSEALAYAYQFWAAKHPDLRLGQKAEGFFAKIAEYFRKLTGLLNADEKTQKLFQAFHDGKLQDPSVAGLALAKLNSSADRVAAVVKSTEPFRRGVGDWLGSAEDNLLKSPNKTLQGIGKAFADHNNGYLQATDRSEKQWLGKLKELLEPHEKDDIHAALEGLQTGKLSSDKEIRAVQEKLVGRDFNGKGFLGDMHDYFTKAGISDYNQETKKWETVKHLNGYFPRSWNMDELYKRGPEFVGKLLEHHAAELQGIADTENKSLKEGGTPMTAADVAHSIYNRLMGSNGQESLAEDGYSLGYSPMMKAVNRRSLKWIDMTKFHDFQNKDLVNIMSTYIMQGAKRAEYTRRFGPDGSVIRDQMDVAHKEETERVMRDNAGMSEDDAKIKALKNMAPAQRAIMAMEGTLGHDINPTLRKAQGWVLAYQNWRMLPMALFSNMIDPLGILVRGGTMDDTFKSYKSAMSDIVNSWRGKDRQDNLMHMSEAIGTLDAHGYMSSMGTMMNSIYMAGGAKHMNDTLFRINGMEALNRSLRGSATSAAIGFIKRHATQPNEHSERLLKELNLDADYVKSKIGEVGDIKEAQGLDVTDPRIQNAIAQWVNEAILRPTSAQRPSRGSDPHYALIMHFKGFMYAMQKQILSRAAKEARLGNYTPGATLALGYIPIMYAADMAKLIVQNAATGGADMPPWWAGMDAEAHAKYAAQRAGLFGSAQIGVDAREYGPLAALGPTAEQVGGLFTDPMKDSIMHGLPGYSMVGSTARAVND